MKSKVFVFWFFSILSFVTVHRTVFKLFSSKHVHDFADSFEYSYSFVVEFLYLSVYSTIFPFHHYPRVVRTGMNKGSKSESKESYDNQDAVLKQIKHNYKRTKI